MPPVTTYGHWTPPPPVLTTVRERLRSGAAVGRGYGILHHLARREPSPPASRNRPPLPSDSEDSLSDMTVMDLGLETDGAVIGLDRYSDVDEPASPSAAASLDQAVAMASAFLTTTDSAEGASATGDGMPSTLDLTSCIDMVGAAQSTESEGSGPSCGVGLSVLGADQSPDGTHPLGQGVTGGPAAEEPVREEDVPPGLEVAELDTATCPETPEINEPEGQGLSSTPEEVSGSLPCGQRVVTPESSDSSFEVISDTESDSHPACRSAPAPVLCGTLGSIPGTSFERPLLRFEDLFALARSAPVNTFDVAADNIRSEFQTVHDRYTLSALLMAMATARAATAAELYQEAVQFVGEGQESSSAFLELIRHLDDLRQFR